MGVTAVEHLDFLRSPNFETLPVSKRGCPSVLLISRENFLEDGCHCLRTDWTFYTLNLISKISPCVRQCDPVYSSYLRKDVIVSLLCLGRNPQKIGAIALEQVGLILSFESFPMSRKGCPPVLPVSRENSLEDGCHCLRRGWISYTLPTVTCSQVLLV